MAPYFVIFLKMYTAIIINSARNKNNHLFFSSVTSAITLSQLFSMTAVCFLKPSNCNCIALDLHSFGNDSSNAFKELLTTSTESWIADERQHEHNVKHKHNKPKHFKYLFIKYLWRNNNKCFDLMQHKIPDTTRGFDLTLFGKDAIIMSGSSRCIYPKASALGY